MRKVNERDAYLRQYKAWNYVRNRDLPMSPYDDYIYLLLNRVEFKEFGDGSHRDGFLGIFYEYFLPDDDNREDSLADNADVTYSNQFLFVPFKDAMKEYFQNP